MMENIVNTIAADVDGKNDVVKREIDITLIIMMIFP